MKVLLTLFLFCVNSFLYTQILTVLDKNTSLPIALVTISGKSPSEYIITNAKGQADIKKFKGAEEIILQMIGYKKVTASYSDLENKNFIYYMIPSTISIDQVVVSASKWNQSKKEIPYRISNINTKDLDLQNPQTSADLLANSGEVYIQKSQQGGGSPMIRGFSTNRLLITIDGIRMNTAIFRSGNLQNVISLDPYATEKTEVIFGPGSVIYGSDAISGVMSFYTLSPQFSLNDRAYLKGTAGSRYSSTNNEFTKHFDVNLGWKNFASITSFSHFRFGDLKMGNDGPAEYLRPEYVERINGEDKILTNSDPLVQKPTAYSQTNVMQKFKYAINNSWDFNYGFHYSRTTNYDRYDRLLRYKNGKPRSAEWYYGPQIWMMNNFTVNNNSFNSFYDKSSLKLTHQYFKESRFDRDLNDSEKRNRVEKVYAYSVNLDFMKSFTDQNQLVYGAEAVYNKVNSAGTNEDITTGIMSIGPSRYPQAGWYSYALYATYNHYVSNSLLLQAGWRYNQYILDARFDTTFYQFPFTTANINEGAFTGNLGLAFNPSESWSFSANLSTGFRSPNVDDLGKVFDSEPGFVIVPNPNLKAEYVYNAEVGIGKIFGEFLNIDLTGYYTLLDDALVRRNFQLNGLDSIFYDGELSRIQAIQNAAQATVWGIQAGLEVKLPYGFEFTSRFNYQKGNEELDDGTTSPLRHAAPWFGISHLIFSIKKIKLDFYSIYNGEVSYDDLPQEERGKDYIYAIDGSGNPYSPGWYTLNLKAIYQLTGYLSIAGGIENLLDKRYRSYSSGIVAPGRNFIVSLKAGF